MNVAGESTRTMPLDPNPIRGLRRNGNPNLVASASKSDSRVVSMTHGRPLLLNVSKNVHLSLHSDTSRGALRRAFTEPFRSSSLTDSIQRDISASVPGQITSTL